MRISIVASIWISVPPKGFGFGAQEYLAYYIAEGLQKKGHQVTLFASGDSKTNARLVSITPKQVEDINFPDPKIKDMFELMNLSAAYKVADSFDIIHNHLLPYGLPFAPLTSTPTVHTLHHEIYNTRAGYFLYKNYPKQNYISISNTQRKIMPELNYIATVHNGSDPNFYAFKKIPDQNYMLFLGRMKKYKGIHTAIKLAQQTGIKFIVASPLPNPNQSDYNEVMEYWKTEIQPNLNKNIEHIDNLKGEDKVTFIQNAKVLISPNEREEPFGMTLIEAMACGTPVIAYNDGACSEIIVNNKTGFLVDQSAGIQGLREALKKIYNMPQDEYLIMRQNARGHFEKNFTVEKMVDEYEKVYRKVLGDKNK
ncbi:MAG: glycosyltransferase family 4 protein [Candidatus Levybacteria bacterium]|nr:glycosyltransferase family 4 protein [Candidatus Levybacteria bacterium]